MSRSAEALSRRFSARTASGLFSAISRAVARAACERVVVDGGGEAVAERLLARELPPGEGELADHVAARELAHQRDAAHVGHEAPFDLENGELRVGRDVADVGAERDLEAAAEGDAVHRRDHRHGQPRARRTPPLRADWRSRACASSRSAMSAVALPRGDRCEAPHVEAGREAAPRAIEHGGAQTRQSLQPLARLGQRLEHGGIKGVELVRPVEPHLRDPFRKGQNHAAL